MNPLCDSLIKVPFKHRRRRVYFPEQRKSFIYCQLISLFVNARIILVIAITMAITPGYVGGVTLNIRETRTPSSTGHEPLANTWTNMNPDTKPDARIRHAMAYDSESDRVILFGGYGPHGYLWDTWAYDFTANRWKDMNPGIDLGLRSGHGMAYDSESDRVILFGGRGPVYFFSDTWAYDYNTNTWTMMNPKTKPDARTGHAMAYDSESDKVILFGGYYYSGGDKYLSDTWVYDYNTNTWTMMNPKTKPDARTGHAMAYDSESDRVILFGGEGSSGYFSDTWAYDYNTNTWTNLTPLSGPNARAYHAMAYDSKSDRVILFGGEWMAFSDTWVYDYNTNTWTMMNPSTSPGARSKHAMAYDSKSDRVILFGGFSIYYLSDTWVYDDSEDTSPPYVVLTLPSNGAKDVPVDARITIQWSEAMNRSSAEGAFSSTPLITCTWSWSGTEQTCIPGSTLHESTTYKITLSTAAKDSAGNAMRTPYTFEFTTGSGGGAQPNPNVTETFPQDGATNVPINTNIVITFDTGMDESATQRAISSNPSITGRFRWDSTSKVVTWDPDSNLIPNMKYTVKIETEARSSAGKPLLHPYLFDFTTGSAADTTPPVVVSTYPKDGDTDVPLNIKITITFSEGMHKTITEGAIMLSSGSVREKGWIDEKTFWFTADLKEGENYTITISTDAMDLAGNRMQSEYKFTFTTGREPVHAVEEIAPWIILIGAIVIVIILVILFRRKKKLPAEELKLTFKKGR
jgi:N-acetylneuraminic acid mutarotase